MMQRPAVGTLKDVSVAVTDPIGLLVLSVYGIGGAIVGGGLGWALGWPINKSAIVGAAIPVLGILAMFALQQPKPTPQPVSLYGY